MINYNNYSPWDDRTFNKTSKNFSKYNFFQNFNGFKFNNGSGSKIIVIAVMIVIFLLVISGIYEVREGTESVVLRFGKYLRNDYPGLNYHIPYIDHVIVKDVHQSRRIEIGYRSLYNSDHDKTLSNESTMLTGDERIVELNCDVTWHISNLKNFLFNISNPETTVKLIAESAIREVVGSTAINSILSDKKQEINDKIHYVIQHTLDRYDNGIGIVIDSVKLLKADPPQAVRGAYNDVQTAIANKAQMINHALSYKNDLLPRTRGECTKILSEAEGYRLTTISDAEGAYKRLNELYKQYQQNPQITKIKMRSDALAKILSKVKKVIGNTNNTILLSESSNKLLLQQKNK